MRKYKFMLLFLITSPVVLAGDRWNTTLPGGGMRFKGEIIAESCRVEVGDRQMTVNMGQVSSNRFHGVGSDTDPVTFQIHLQDCNTSVSQQVGVAFKGVADGKNPDVLSVTDGAGAALGVGVAIFDQQGNLIPLNSPPQSWTKLMAGPVLLDFVAKYRATNREVTGGVANAQVWFSLTYQ